VLAAKDPLFNTANLPATKPSSTGTPRGFRSTGNEGHTEKIAEKSTALTSDTSPSSSGPRQPTGVAQVTFTGISGAAERAARRRPRVAIGSPYTTPGSAKSWNSAVRPVYEQAAACGSRLRSAPRR